MAERENGALGSTEVGYFGTTPVVYEAGRPSNWGEDCASLHLGRMRVRDVDEVAFWQGLIWDCPLGTRCTDRRIRYVPSHSRAVMEGGAPTLEWLPAEAYPTDLSEKELVAYIDRALQSAVRQVLERLTPTGRVLLPLSAGLDARLLAVHLAQSGFDLRRVDLVTYAYGRSSLEYLLATRIGRILGFGRHHFWKLSRDSYFNHGRDFFDSWHGDLSVLHGHLYGFLQEHRTEYELMISGFLGDAVAGFAASPPGSSGDRLENTAVYRTLETRGTAMGLPGAVRGAIRQDLEVLYEQWRSSRVPVEFYEYYYHTQREPKMVGPLLQMYRKILSVGTPYGAPEVVRGFLACPYAIRKDKRISRMLLAHRCPEIASVPDVSSSLSDTTISSSLVRLSSIAIGRIAIGTAYMTNDRLRPLNPFGTEDAIGAARKECRPAIVETIGGLLRAGLLTSGQSERFLRKPVRSYDVSPLYRIMSLRPALLDSSESARTPTSV
jgi:hypothetical protein